MHHPNENDTFKTDNPDFLNACVGQNGYNGIYSYELGFGTATEILLEHVKNNSGLVDALVYPIVFSARHKIELFLKTIIEKFARITDMKQTGARTNIRTHTHDLKILWETAEELSSVDVRFSESIELLKPFVEDYFSVDLTGETFRYPFASSSNEHHLEDLSCINLYTFENRFKQLSLIAEYIHRQLDSITEEYSLGTHTPQLSREQLESIALSLPPRNEWGSDEFIKLRDKFTENLNISRKNYSAALEKIQTHSEFARHIGLTCEKSGIKKANIEFYINTLNEYHSKSTKDEEREPDNIESVLKKIKKTPFKRCWNFVKRFFKCSKASNPKRNSENLRRLLIIKNNFADRLSENLPHSALVAIATFREIGRYNEYSEKYEKIESYYAQKTSKDIAFNFLLDNKLNLDYVFKGIKQTGQIQLL